MDSSTGGCPNTVFSLRWLALKASESLQQWLSPPGSDTHTTIWKLSVFCFSILNTILLFESCVNVLWSEGKCRYGDDLGNPFGEWLSQETQAFTQNQNVRLATMVNKKHFCLFWGGLLNKLSIYYREEICFHISMMDMWVVYWLRFVGDTVLCNCLTGITHFVTLNSLSSSDCLRRGQRSVHWSSTNVCWAPITFQTAFS